MALWILLQIAQVVEDVSAWERILERYGLATFFAIIFVFAIIYMYKNSVRMSVYNKLCVDIEQLSESLKVLGEAQVQTNVNQAQIVELQNVTTQTLAAIGKQLVELDADGKKHHEMMMELRRMNGSRRNDKSYLFRIYIYLRDPLNRG